MLFLTFFTLTLVFSCSLVSGIIILKPPTRTNVTQYDAALVFIQGANIVAKDYTKFSLQLQQKFNGNLWVALTEFVGNLPEPVLISSVVNGAFADLQKAGLKLNQKTPVFFVGHSLGGAVIQNFLLKDDKYATLPVYVAGVVLEGAFVTRSNRAKSLESQKPPILTLGAELDGLCRITRMAESFFFNQNTAFSRVTVVVRGMNHYQFSGEGAAPSFVVKNDIKPEISDESARDQITSIINSFMQISLARASPQDNQVINSAIADTNALVSPLIQAFQLEGFYHFEPPCYDTKNDPSKQCFKGSPWTTQYSQRILANSDTAALNVEDTFTIVYEPPEHLPKVLNTCTTPGSCVLNVTTVSQNVYSLEDGLDTGLQPVAAEEIRTKMASRQAVYLAATGTKYDFNTTDGGSLCATINSETLKWAQSNAPAATVRRYLSIGVPLVPVDDVQESAGPLWIWNPLSFKDAVDPNTQKHYVALKSPMMRFPVDYSLKAVAGIHYCKVLSPARAMEWFYVDSLKPKSTSLLSSLLSHIPYVE